MINGPKFLKTGKINERVLYRGSGKGRGEEALSTLYRRKTLEHVCEQCES